MGKAEQKRSYILDKAKEVFAEKGFACVTMKDIVEACAISRGGLYRYFSSTSEIFLSLFERDAAREQQRTELTYGEGTSARQIIQDYCEVQKKNLMNSQTSLTMASYEFFTKYPENRVILQWQFDGIAEMFREIIDYGIKNGEFYIKDASALARHLAIFFSGLKFSGPIYSFPEERLDEQFKLLLTPLFD